MTVMGKMVTGKIVEIVRVADQVQFSPERGWVCIVGDFDKRPMWQQDIKWIPASTRFEWVREFNFA